MTTHTIGLYTVTEGETAERARGALSNALEGATLGEPDGAGSFSLEIEAESHDAALLAVRDALAGSGTQDDFVIRQRAAELEPEPGPREVRPT